MFADAISSALKNYGRIVGRRPGVACAVGILLCTVITLAGMAHLRDEADPLILFTPTTTEVIHERSRYFELFGSDDVFVTSFIVTRADGRSVMSTAGAAMALQLHETVTAVSTASSVERDPLSLSDVCLTLPTGECYVNSVLRCLGFDVSAFGSSDVLPITSPACLDAAGFPVFTASSVGGDVSVVPEGGPGLVVSAKALRFDYFLNARTPTEVADATAFEAAVEQALDTFSFSQMAGNRTSANDPSDYVFTYNTVTAFGRVLEAETAADLPVLGVAMCILVIAIALGSAPTNRGRGQGLAGFAGIVTALFSTAVGMGACGLFGVPTTPFILYAVVVQLAFYIHGLFVLQRELNATAAAIYPCEQVAQALSGAGVSVIATNTAGVVTAAVVLQIAEYGIVKFTAAAIALMLLSNVLVTLSILVAVLAAGAKLSSAKASTCCFGSATAAPGSGEKTGANVGAPATRIINVRPQQLPRDSADTMRNIITPPVDDAHHLKLGQAVEPREASTSRTMVNASVGMVVAVTLAGVAIGAAGISSASHQFAVHDAVRPDSFIATFSTQAMKYFTDIAVPTYTVIDGPVQYWSADVQATLSQLQMDLTASSHTPTFPPADSWLTSYAIFMTAIEQPIPQDEAEFVLSVLSFLAADPAFARYRMDLVLASPDGTQYELMDTDFSAGVRISASRIMVLAKPAFSLDQQEAQMTYFREKAAAVGASVDAHAFAHQQPFYVYEQQTHAESLSWQASVAVAIGMSVGAIFMPGLISTAATVFGGTGAAVVGIGCLTLATGAWNTLNFGGAIIGAFAPIPFAFYAVSSFSTATQSVIPDNQLEAASCVGGAARADQFNTAIQRAIAPTLVVGGGFTAAGLALTAATSAPMSALSGALLTGYTASVIVAYAFPLAVLRLIGNQRRAETAVLPATAHQPSYDGEVVPPRQDDPSRTDEVDTDVATEAHRKETEVEAIGDGGVLHGASTDVVAES